MALGESKENVYTSKFIFMNFKGGLRKAQKRNQVGPKEKYITSFISFM